MDCIRYCGFCRDQLDIAAHPNRKYCSKTCEYRARYKRSGQRSTPEQRKAWLRERLQNRDYKERIRQQGREQYNKVQAFLRDYKTFKGCKDCGYNDHHAALEFDHINGTKEFNVCNSKSISQAKKEISKCEVVCSNCHAIRTFNRLQHEEVKLI